MEKTRRKVAVKKDGLTVIDLGTPAWKKLQKEWAAVKGKVPAEKGFAERMGKRLDRFWEEVEKENPLWIPWNLAIGDVEEIQAQVDRLTEKARRKEVFEAKEKDFLAALYSWIAWGGLAKWLPEASQLLRHYLSCTGNPIEIDSYVYRSSVIVKYAMEEMKRVILEDIKKSGGIRNGGSIQSLGIVKNTNRTAADQHQLGNVFGDGMLLAEQRNQRLKNADNRFFLDAKCRIVSQIPLKISILWKVDSKWDYESFENQKQAGTEHVTALPLKNDSKLRLHDGLSNYLETLGLAKIFNHYSKWDEDWSDAE